MWHKYKNIKIIEGNSSVLISAPHAAPIKKTVDGRTYTRMAETRADEIVEIICKKNGTWGIFTVSGKNPIFNWQENIYGEYKKIVKKLVKTQGVSLIIDIHGAKKTRPFYIDYDFLLPNKHPNDIAVEKLLKKTFAQYFPSEELSNGFYRKIKGSGKKTLTYYIRKHLKLPAIQLEINKTLKEDDEMFERVIKMLYTFIDTYENTFIGFQPKKEVLYGQKTSQ